VLIDESREEAAVKVKRRIALVGMAAGIVVGVLSGTASADQPTPPTCWAALTNQGQFAAFTLSNLGAEGQPGLSAFTPPNAGFSVGNFTTGFQADACGVH
jgi:hypothetical protein